MMHQDHVVKNFKLGTEVSQMFNFNCTSTFAETETHLILENLKILYNAFLNHACAVTPNNRKTHICAHTAYFKFRFMMVNDSE